MICISTANSHLDETAETSRRLIWAIRFALLFASILMIAAARGDLWLDEIWSLSFARNAKSATDIFVHFRFGNNHPLNTLFLYFAGEQKYFLAYRLFAILSGIGSLVLIGHIAKKEWGSREALCSIILSGTSFPLLLYFSEARGYAPEIFFALACYALLRRNSYDFSKARLILFWAASVLGILSHSAFIIATIAFLIGNLASGSNAAGSVRQKSLRFIAHHAPPLVFYAWWYIFYLKNMIIGGGPVYSALDVIAYTSALSLGFPGEIFFSSTAFLCVMILIITGVICLYLERNPQWLFFLSVLFLSPLIVYILSHAHLLYVRYLIACFPFLYLLLSHLICKLYRSSPVNLRFLAIVIVAILILGQAKRDFLLLKFGRGQYLAALEYIVKNSPNTVIRIGSDHDFRNAFVISFYTTIMSEGKRLCYITQPEWYNGLPDWIILHSQDSSYRPPDKIVIDGTLTYSLAKEFKHAELSGWDWFLFRREKTARLKM